MTEEGCPCQLRFEIISHFSLEGLRVDRKTIERFLARAVRLYEEEQEEPFGYGHRPMPWLPL